MNKLFRRVANGDKVIIGDESFIIAGAVGDLIRIKHKGYVRTLTTMPAVIGDALVSARIENGHMVLYFSAPDSVVIHVLNP